MTLRRIDWIAYAISLIKYRGWDKHRAVRLVRKLYRYERRRLNRMRRAQVRRR